VIYLPVAFSKRLKAPLVMLFAVLLRKSEKKKQGEIVNMIRNYNFFLHQHGLSTSRDGPEINDGVVQEVSKSCVKI
jgi:hypothetical protein